MLGKESGELAIVAIVDLKFSGSRLSINIQLIFVNLKV